MTNKAQSGVSSPPATGVTSLPPRRGPGHRGQDARDTAAEMAQRAHEISLEAGSKMSGAIRDVISAAAGLLSPFPIESARDLVNYMVKRGQMPQEDADKLIATAEAAHGIKPLPRTEPVQVPAMATVAMGTVSSTVQRGLERASSKPTTPPPAPSPASKAPPKAPSKADAAVSSAAAPPAKAAASKTPPAPAASKSATTTKTAAKTAAPEKAPAAKASPAAKAPPPAKKAATAKKK
jgi:hypothetical protein